MKMMVVVMIVVVEAVDGGGGADVNIPHYHHRDHHRNRTHHLGGDLDRGRAHGLLHVRGHGESGDRRESEYVNVTEREKDREPRSQIKL